ncbi:Peptidase M16C associated domain protein [Desulfosarcina cetonica]|uniref:insulinase family protein n=1 Tax=Desulfosarcina cetonica TaxID=90730 RepID=UPI0006CFF908|nr:insulinase family protein [Desulfosarcina cetonica]VTR68101.1 Peptidase M16C associated domain protein [Desulfosarcina cetonica]
MKTEADINNPGIHAGSRLGGYTVNKVTRLTDIQAWLYQLTHEKTGARHIHISNTDGENTFGVAFKTVPEDATGVAHILEHTVLCGSARFPVRDPFFSMLKRSLSTFMNAFTASDWTMYPFSTQNRKDYYNLMDVYLDAAFFPNIDALSFKQEGHRLEVEGEGEERQLVYKGVVYNEMKGAMSSPDQVMVRSLLNALYPDTTYRHNSGGDPADIPSLTHAQLKAFHARHYHPSNAYFYTYGNLPLAEHLAFIQARVLDRFTLIDPKTDVPQQPRWSAPRTVTYAYPLDPGEDPTQKYQACVAWLLSDIRDTFEMLVTAVIEQVLIGNAASPLRKALMDSQLGTALADGTGFDAENRDTMFSVGLKDVGADDAPAVEEIIFKALKALSDNGIDPELVESAIHQIEFHRKEITNTPYPYGIKLLIGVTASWLHGGDPERILQLDADFERLRQALAGGRFLETKIREYFLDNPHRVRFTLRPDQQMAEKERQRVAGELARRLANLSEADLARIQSDAAALEKLQEAPEDLTRLPTLERTDIPPKVACMDPTAGIFTPPVWAYDQPTSGIFYFSGGLGAGSIEGRLLPLVPFFCYSASKMGTSACDYTRLARRIDLYTGGIGFAANARIRFDDHGDCLPFVSFTGKCLNRNQAQLFAIFQELASQLDFADHSRLRQLVLEYRAGLEAAVVHNGHRLAISLSARNFSPSNYLQEMWGGIHQLHAIKAVAEQTAKEDLTGLAADLNAIAQALFCRENIELALIGEKKMLIQAGTPIQNLGRTLAADGKPGFVAPGLDMPTDRPREGWSTSTAVSFVAQTFPTVRLGHPDSPALAVIAKMLRSLYLHREIREKGGAYGGFAIYNAEDGLFSFGSYRDPHIENTLKVYNAAAGFICSGSFSEEDVKEAILQVCSEIDKPDPPGPAARKAFFRRMIGLTDETRLHHKESLLTLDKKAVLAAAERYFDDGPANKAVAVISSRDRLDAANQSLGAAKLRLHTV